MWLKGEDTFSIKWVRVVFVIRRGVMIKINGLDRYCKIIIILFKFYRLGNWSLKKFNLLKII